MKKIELAKGINASVIGFGCSPIMGPVDSKQGKYAIDLALEHGINYFDVARSYGYGEAEGFLGRILKNKKNEVYVATKFGINPNWKANSFKKLKPLFRYVQSLKSKEPANPEVKKTAPSELSKKLLDRIEPLRGKDMRKSLEKSLKELQREYVDCLFIHEPHHSLKYVQELKETAEILKKEGKIRSFGLSALHSQEKLHKKYLDKFDLLQYDNPMVRDDYDEYKDSGNEQPDIIFSPFKGGLSQLKTNSKTY
ncbi:aldo/keto reductase [Antarcticibacterium sp. 1MA-6-2]|uniref:aldo/keto reductase n=1 Tax=Antarcticibacterium sp. 1MA-6-2 TaxID=2908210 RepID=UPI001F35A772|nr:aldo/keto reductase [Antarcticibacterium sp. 1MA-6-2]UJH91743.1 aldo/keto reductase [Antarcticibacterium sp. 1MA-6-2]